MNMLVKNDHDMYYILEDVGKVEFVDKVLDNYRTNTGRNISLRDNGVKAHLWHLVGAIDACPRRGLLIENIVLKDYEMERSSD